MKRILNNTGLCLRAACLIALKPFIDELCLLRQILRCDWSSIEDGMKWT